MTQNPYAQFGSPSFGGPAGGAVGGGGGIGGDGFDPSPTPQRTSAMAIFSFILSLLCCLPGPGALAIIFGGAAILFISNSRGRLGGLGLAIAGVLIGLITTVLWLFIFVGAISMMSSIVAPTNQMMAALESGDYATARQNFAPTLDQAVTDQQLAEFVAAYQADVGSFNSIPSSMWEFFGGYMKVGGLLQNHKGGEEIPLPANFDKGMGIVMAGIPQGGAAQPSGGGLLPRLVNVGVLLPAGKEIWLLDPDTRVPADNSGTGGAPPSTAPPSTAPPSTAPPSTAPADSAPTPAEGESPDAGGGEGSTGGG